ncbi:MAG: putative glycoside hydrolase [Candidatus Kerfeldbacteria bacterium]
MSAFPAAAARPDDAPKIVNWNFSWGVESKEQAEELAQWDVLIIDIEAALYTPKRLEYIKELNPNIKLLAYVSISDIRKDAHTLDAGTSRRYLGTILQEHPDWILRDTGGNPVEWWPGNYICNLSNKAPVHDGARINDIFARFVRDWVIKEKIWDGVFIDNLYEGISFAGAQIDLDQDGVAESAADVNAKWRKGVRSSLKQIKTYARNNRKKFIITGNGGALYDEQVNGIGLEHFPKTTYGKWTKSMKKYYFIMENGVPAQYAFINTNSSNKDGRTQYKKFRYGLMSSLLNDGYYSFDKGDLSHAEQWWYDEYEVSLGDPVSGAYNLLRPDDPTALRKGVWRRDFENASVFVNSTSEKQTITLNMGYEKIHGTQAVDVNSGENVGSITINAHDGIILLRRLTQVRDATFINGAFSKVFGYKGRQQRNSFFAYDGSFAGGTQIHKISRNGKTVVADNTWVRVYDSRNNQIAAFAPYGDGYAGGVNIAVGALYGGKKKYVVTGNKTGTAFVRIWDLKGNLVHSGCVPYGSFAGGVNVGVGNLSGNKQLEIVVAAGYGGGPHIRVLDNHCNLINPGFFAFPSEWRIGVNIAVGDLDGNGTAEIIAAPGPGGGPHVRIFDNNGTLLSPGFFAYDESDRSGVLVTTADIDGDGDDEIVTNSFSIFNQL